MTIPRMTALKNYWNAHPPTHIAIARCLGVKGTEKPKTVTPEEKNNNLGELLALFPSGVIGG